MLVFARDIVVCSSRLARLAIQISAGRLLIVRKLTSRPLLRVQIGSVRTQSGRCLGASFWKKNCSSTPFGYRFMVSARPLRWGSSTSETRS